MISVEIPGSWRSSRACADRARPLLAAFVLFAGSTLVSSGASAADHVVQLKNDDGKGNYKVFVPDFLHVAVGDTITFKPGDMGHNAETIPEIWPSGPPQLKGAMSKPATLKIEKEGVYGIKCNPHFPLGMMAFIVAGKPTNIDEVEKFKAPQYGQKRFDALKAEVESVK